MPLSRCHYGFHYAIDAASHAAPPAYDRYYAYFRQRRRFRRRHAAMPATPILSATFDADAFIICYAAYADGRYAAVWR